jgi:hypothetical protein
MLALHAHKILAGEEASFNYSGSKEITAHGQLAQRAITGAAAPQVLAKR